MPRHISAALGVRVKSGWAMTVLLTGPVSAPHVLDRRRIELSDPAVPRTRQPYHAGFGMAQRSRRTIARLVRTVERCAQASFAAAVRRYRGDGVKLRGVGLVVGSVIDPAQIANPHIRAHAAEGALFRRVVHEAALRQRLGTITVLERDVYATAARLTSRTAVTVKGIVAELGNTLDGPWRADEKTAAAAAWVVLARRLRPSRR
jgi:hypothetical protein